MADAARPTPQAVLVPVRRSWSLPLLRELPKLTDLTLASAIGGTGGTGGGGSTVFTLLLAVLSLAGLPSCAPEQSMEPSAPAMPAPVAAVQCQADVAAGTVACDGGPAGAPGQAILGGQGISLLLGTTIVVYNSYDSSFVFIAKITNLSAQPIGMGLNGPANARIFFEQAPHAVTGTGAITFIGDSIGTFTASNQHYYVVQASSILPRQTSGGALIKFHVPPSVQTFAFTVLVSTELVEAGGPVDWSPVAGRNADAFHGVAAAGPNEALAVGLYGASRRWDGSAWHDLVPYTESHLDGVTALGGGEYLAVGSQGRIWRLRGAVWSLLYTESHGYDLTTVWAEDSGHYVAAGERGATVTYDGGAFTEQVLSSGSDTAIAVSGKSDGSAVAVLLRSNAVYTSTGGAAFVQTGAIAGAGGGAAYDGNDELLWAYFDLATSEAVVRLEGAEISRVSGDRPVGLNIYAGTTAVIATYNSSTHEGYVDQFDYGTLPATINHITAPFPHEVRSMDIAGAIVLMTTTDNAILRRQTGVHNDQPVAGPAPELWGIGDTAWIVTGGTSGTIGRIVDGELTEVATVGLGGIDHITGISSTELYLANGGGISRIGGDGSYYGGEIGIGYPRTFTALWGDTASGGLLAVVDDGAVFTRVGGSWNYFLNALPAGGAVKVWGCSPSDVLIASGGKIWRWDGTTATQDLNYDANIGPAQINGISGTSCTDIWVAHAYGAAHFDGTNWADAHVSPMTAVVARSTGLAWLLEGSNGYDRIGVPDGSGWGIRIPTQHRAITAAWRLASGELLVAGNGLLLWGHR